MTRHFIAALTVGALVAVAGVAPATSQLLAQAEEEQPAETEEQQPLVPAPVELDLGERFTSILFDLEAQSIFRASHPELEEKTEVRIAVAMRNNTDLSFALNDTVFVSSPNYPRFVLVDAAGVERPLSGVRMQHTSVGQYDLRELAPGMTARWTIGFQVPTDASGDLELVARDIQGNGLAVWDLEDRGMRAGWAPPARVEAIGFGEPILWDDEGLEATAIEHGSLLCGNPNVEYVTHIFALKFEVGNRNFAEDLLWPGSTFPETAAIAQWSDGAAAAVTSETFAAPEELLRKIFTDQINVPSTEEPDYGRALLFGVPRDGRLGSVADSPDGVLLNLPDGSRRWLDITGPATLAMNPALCDVDFFDFPIPYAFAPSLGFDVAAVPLPDDPVVLDREARELLTQALVNASVYHRNNGTYAGVSSSALEAIWGAVDFTNDERRAKPGVVAWDVPIEDRERQQIVLTTRSGTGTYFCAINDADPDAGGNETRYGEGETLDEILAACEPIVETVPTDGGTTETTTTTTTAPAGG